ncbi:MAG TPA: ComF family protein [Hyphomicrobiaceae bacterium]|nr:ComF family protein [Hyphomicrobiaceae bacterium]
MVQTSSTEITPEEPEPNAAPPTHQRLPILVTRSLRHLVDIITPPLCLKCHEPLSTQDTLCPACWRTIDFIRPPLCERLGIPLPFDSGAGTLSAKALAEPPVYGRARAVARYDGVMRQMIHDFKFRDRHDASKLFGRWMAEAGASLIADADVIAPVPLHRWKLLKRRFNQSALLATQVSQLTGIPNAPLALARTRKTVPQLGLTAIQRQQNVKGAFSVPSRQRPAIEGRRVLLVDDVITTGATISAATRALLAAGASSVDILALALVTDTTATLSA